MRQFDAIILGSGPAGVSAALKLTRLGRRVALISNSQTRVQRQLETVANTAVLKYALPNVVLESPGAIYRTQHGVSWWTGHESTTDSVAVVDREVLDSALLKEAMNSGAAVYSVEKNAIRVSPDSAWHVTFSGVQLQSLFIIDATGRHSSFRKRETLVPWRQVGMMGEVRLDGDPPGLWTETLPDGWLWAIRGAGRQWRVSIFVDPSLLREGHQQLWARLIGESRLAVWLAAAAKLVTTIEVTPVAASHAFGKAIFHAGDAALARDPLASQGLTAAISDGQSAAIAVHTLLSEPAKESIVSAFLEDRHRQAKQRHLKFLSESYADAPFESPFWTARRAGASKRMPQEMPVQVQLDCPLTLSSEWRMRDCPVLEEDSIRLAQCLCSKDESVRWLAGRPIQDLLPSASQKAGSLLHQWVNYKLVPEPAAFQAMRWLTSRGVLIPTKQ